MYPSFVLNYDVLVHLLNDPKDVVNDTMCLAGTHLSFILSNCM